MTPPAPLHQAQLEEQRPFWTKQCSARRAAGGLAGQPREIPAVHSERLSTRQNAFQHIGLPDRTNQRLLDLSSIAEGFAEHFIMDAFSAGHLFNKDDFIAQLKTNLDKCRRTN